MLPPSVGVQVVTDSYEDFIGMDHTMMLAIVDLASQQFRRAAPDIKEKVRGALSQPSCRANPDLE